ncbi:putative phage tail protein [Lysobacter sp. GCM10012299]|uniref:putative phage tail protein n=1 Tax=Lysobacter sp. GCM10012299 TaxID=3317333 RepID=UPI0036120424
MKNCWVEPGWVQPGWVACEAELESPTTMPDKLAEHLPEGRAWMAKRIPGTNIRALVEGVAASFSLFRDLVARLDAELDITKATELIREWETSVGLPSACVSLASKSLEDRRADVIARLRRTPVVTKAEFEELGRALTGLDVRVEPGAAVETFPLRFPLNFSSDGGRFTLYVYVTGFTHPHFPYAFPIPLGAYRSPLLECIFERITPANVRLVFVYH